MPFTPPEPGEVERAEISLLLNVLRVDLAIVQHLLARRQDENLSGLADDLRSGIARLEKLEAEPQG